MLPRRLVDPHSALLTTAAGSTLLIAGAWFFEIVLKLLPCKLCLEQRQPHYAAMALGVIILLLAALRRDLAARLLRPTLFLMAGLYLWSIGLGAYHSGVEWGWFPAPTDCGGTAPAPSGSMQDFLKQLETVKVVSCSEAAWRFLGLSLAGWNVVGSLALLLIAIAGLRRRGA